MCSNFDTKYAVKSKIGEGTFSEVLKCQKLSSGQCFAVKKLKKQFHKLSEVDNLPELLILEKLPFHPNVLSLLEYIFEPQDGRLYMIFELMDMSLYDLLLSRKKCIPETKVKHIFYQLLKGVDHLHTHGYIHRDIKPENILVKKTTVKLADLGSIRGVYSQRPFTEYISTRWYRSPECILTSGIYGPKMDVWACGCVYYELLTTKPIFPGSNEVDQLSKIHQLLGTPTSRVLSKLRGHQPKPSDLKFAVYPSTNLALLLPFTSDGGRDILKLMLTYDPEKRTNTRRLLEHRYFGDLRETEYILEKEANILAKQRSIPTMTASETAKRYVKPKLCTNQVKQTEGTKPFKTHSLGPTCLNEASQTNAKLRNNMKTLYELTTNLKKTPGTLKHALKNICNANSEVQTVHKKRLYSKLQAATVGNLPNVNNTTNSKVLLMPKQKLKTGSLVNSRTMPKKLLPPILEH